MLNTVLWAALLLLFMPMQVQRRTCDHAAPPEGMHYVCAEGDSCDCHLVRNEDEEQTQENAATQTPAHAPSSPLCESSHVKYFVAPAYPEAARVAGKQGTVIAHVVLGPSGKPDVKIESGDSAFASAVKGNLTKWKFAPEQQAKTLQVSITFALAGEPSRDPETVVSGASPLELVITARPAR